MTFSIRRTNWDTDQSRLSAIRKAVFIEEQSVPLDLEWDGFDECVHVLAENQTDEPIGCGRLLPDGNIGRMAVLKTWRGKGVGSAMLSSLVSIAAEEGLDRVYVHSQTYVKKFYQQHGFKRIGDEFMEAGIPHVKMIKRLAATV
ncbi:MAG: GNAT family N-acetyltransferase [Burkholderiales bacterium]